MCVNYTLPNITFEDVTRYKHKMITNYPLFFAINSPKHDVQCRDKCVSLRSLIRCRLNVIQLLIFIIYLFIYLFIYNNRALGTRIT